MKVLDASAVLALLYGEPGGLKAQAALPDGRLSLATVAEIVGDLLTGGHGSLTQCEMTLRGLGLGWMAMDEDQALRAASMKAIKGLSLGDRFCIALAQSIGAPVVTADQAWASAPLGVTVELIR